MFTYSVYTESEVGVARGFYVWVEPEKYLSLQLNCHLAGGRAWGWALNGSMGLKTLWRTIPTKRKKASWFPTSQTPK